MTRITILTDFGTAAGTAAGTNILAHWIDAVAVVSLAGHTIGPLRRTNGDAAPGEALVYVGSAGLLGIAVRDASAAVWPRVGRGTAVRVMPLEAGIAGVE